MPTFFMFDGIKIDLYFNDHAPPHFHAKYAEYEDIVEIKTLQKMKGNLPRKQHNKVISWADDQQEVLMEIWESLRP